MAYRYVIFCTFLLIGCVAPATDVCEDGDSFAVSKNAVSATMATVGVVEWSLAGAQPSSAKIVYRLEAAAASVSNRGGEAPVDLGKPNHRTLLLGLKQSRDYRFHIEATRDGQTCRSSDYALPTTGRFGESQPATRTPRARASDGKIVELDSAWNEVQTFSVRVGYASWRPTLYGPAPRL